MEIPPGFGPLLRSWRQHTAYSQQRLADAAEVSSRHISFLETGRAAPSREMVLTLANALDLPLRERNALLGAAGFAAAYRETQLDDVRMRRVQRAIDHILAQQEPYGALVTDRLWNVIQVNQGGMRFLSKFLADPGTPEVLGNVMHAFFHPRGVRPFIVDWEQAAGVLISRLHRDARGRSDHSTHALLEGLLSYPGVPQHFARPNLALETDPFLPLHFRRDGVEARLFTLISTLGTPLDVTAEELHIETYFPADDTTERWLRSLAST